MEQLLAARVWVLLWGGIVTFSGLIVFRMVAPPELLTWPATLSQLVVAGAMCLLLTDVFFLNVKIVAFTGEPAREQSNLAITVLKYAAFVPAVAWVPLVFEPWIETSISHLAIAVAAIGAAHLALRYRDRTIIREHCNLFHLEDDEEEFPMRLGLRY
jgi:hypothetical protein